MNKEFDVLKTLKHWREINTEKGVTWIPTFVVEAAEQALQKAWEPKKYLKWEDLEFDAKEQRMNVSLNGHLHLLCYYRNMFGSLCMIDNTGITVWEDNKNFFNDLHLERIE